MRLKSFLLGSLAVLAFLTPSQAFDFFTVGQKATTNPTSGNPNVWPSSGGEDPIFAIDGITGTASNKYLNFGKLNTGYIFTLTSGTAVANGLSLFTGGDAVDRDPTSFTLYGSNSAVATTTAGTVYQLDSSFTKIVDSFALTPPPGTPPTGRNTSYGTISFPNSTPYSTYLLVFPTVFNSAAANSMQIAEARLTNGGTAISNAGIIGGGQLTVAPEPSTAVLVGLAATGLVAMRRRRR